MTASTADRRIRSLRSPKVRADPYTAHGALREQERRPDGKIERALTVFLTGAECPFTCSFCDLWQWTIDGPTPRVALPTPIENVLQGHRDPLPTDLKLYTQAIFRSARRSLG